MEKEFEQLEGERRRLEQKIAELLPVASTEEAKRELERLRTRLQRLEERILAHVPAMGRVKLARHPDRPYTLDFIKRLFTDFTEIHGDRRFADDPAMVCGMARFHGEPVVVIGQQKGRDLKERQYRNFGMAKPEGYRKALRVMKLAEKFGRPVFTLIDTPGAYPGIDAEERGQAEAIAYNLREMARLRTPIIVTITGEGGSGGALGIGVGDVINMLENAIYSVISPEGCAAILWKDAGQADKAAEGLKLTAQDLLSLGLIDRIIPEPRGGAHLDHDEAARILDTYLADALAEVSALAIDELLHRRYEKFRRMGAFQEATADMLRQLTNAG
ncbi:MAG: acetyl-CoA carboxylase carboxyltransferase subunit alpha [Acidobacteria bacterium]|nr:MAG: acetyl-CoA carboxylase carboxyltransferase subunit alpha [Acidobacteriota bacterium]